MLNALYTDKEKPFRARSFCVAKSNANRNSHVLLKYLCFINSFIKSSNAGQHRTNWIPLSTGRDRHRETQRDRDRETERDRNRETERDRHRETETERDRHRETETERDRNRETGTETETERNREDSQRHTQSERHRVTDVGIVTAEHELKLIKVPPKVPETLKIKPFKIAPSLLASVKCT